MSLIKNFSLFIVATILAPILIPTGVITAFIFSIIRMDYSMLHKHLTRLFFYMAVSIDKVGNYACAVLFNLTLIIKNEKAYRFGKEGQTISSALGHNVLSNNLSKLGILLNRLLNLFEKDHAIKAVNEEGYRHI